VGNTERMSTTERMNSTEPRHILVVEDEPSIVRFLDRALTALGYKLHVAETGEDGITQAIAKPIDLVMLDIMLPGVDGHAVLSRIRAEKPDLPVLMLTARDSVEDKVAALDAGAEDYLTKPFALDELIARIRVLIRRSDQQRTSVLQVGNLWMDVVARRVRRLDTPIELSSREFALLEYFMRHPGQGLSRQQILAAIWEYNFDPESNLVDVYVRYLRRKIDRKGRPSCITTIRGMGYRFDAPADS
jgi:DNA-binding response OmpR family regulator